MSYGWWQHKHTRHHANPNKIGTDPDIELPVISVTPDQADRRRAGWPLGWVMAHQGLFFFPILLLEGLSLHASSVRRVFSREPLRRRPSRSRSSPSGSSATSPWCSSCSRRGSRFAFLGVQLGLFGFYMGMAFAPNHKGMPLVPGGREARLPPSPGADEPQHPRQSGARHGDGRAQLPDRAPPVPVDAAAAPARGIPHDRGVLPCARRARTRETGLFESYGIVVRYINRVGLGERDPFECPLLQAAPGGLTGSAAMRVAWSLSGRQSSVR